MATSTGVWYGKKHGLNRLWKFNTDCHFQHVVMEMNFSICNNLCNKLFSPCFLPYHTPGQGKIIVFCKTYDKKVKMRTYNARFPATVVVVVYFWLFNFFLRWNILYFCLQISMCVIDCKIMQESNKEHEAIIY